MAKLILIRHGASTWNEEGRWQGKTDTPPLSAQGRQQITEAAEKIRGLTIDHIFASPLARVRSSEWIIVHDLNLTCPVTISDQLDERDYGIYTGKNKWEMEKELGENVFETIRRGWNTPIPSGETMQDVFDRVIPYFEKTILPELLAGKNILIVSSGNTERALIKYLENLNETEVEQLELNFAEVRAYDIDPEGKITKSPLT